MMAAKISRDPSIPLAGNSAGSSPRRPIDARHHPQISPTRHIYEPGAGPLGIGLLSDTYSVTPNGDPVFPGFNIDFESDIEGGLPLTPLLNNPQSILENGAFQSVGTATLSNGDTVNFTFQSDVSEV